MNLVDRAKNVLFSPASEWETIKSETITNNELFTKYAIILAAIPAVAGLIGYSVFGISFGFGRITLGIGTTLVWAILTYVLSLVSVYVLGWIIDVLAPSFGSVKDLNSSLKVAVYSYTAAWVGGIFHILPYLGFLAALASIYSLVLLYMGLKRVKTVPDDKMVGYFVVIIVVAIVLYFIIGAIVAGVAFGGIMMSSGI
ncbi:MAG: Yip1 family protein [Ignavibacteriaceae bacterium]